jgi:hypothetical protein
MAKNSFIPYKPVIFIPRLRKHPINTYYFNKFYAKPPSDLNSYKIKVIREAVKKETGYDPMLKPKYRKREFTDARQLFSSFVRSFIKNRKGKQFSLKATGSLIDKNYATILSGEKRISGLCETDPKFLEVYKNIETSLKRTLVS